MAKTPPLPEAPVELIRDAAASYDQVQVRIKRQTAKGTWATCGPTVLKPTNELVSLDDWIRELSGGGKYRVETFRPDDPTQPVVPPFWVEIEGPARPIESTRRAMSGPAAAQPPAAGGQPFSPMQWPVPAWRGRWGGDDDDAHLDPSKFMSQTPDAIAMEQTRALREELKELRTQREQERAQHAEELRRLTDKISEMVQKHADETSRREREAFEARIASQLEGGGRTKVDYVGIATAMAPVVIAMITSGKDRQALLADMQQRSLEMQQSNTTTMLSTLTGQKQTDSVKMIEALTGIAMPIITKMMDEKSPSAVAKLIGAMGESNMTTLSIVSQFMQQMQGDDPNPPAWMQLVNEGIKSMVDVAERSMEVAGGQPRTGVAQPQQMQQGPSPTPQQTLPADASPEDIANAIVNAPTVPKELTTKAWFSIFVGLHRGDDPKVVAKKIADAIEAGEETNAMPPMFKDFFASSALPSSMLVQLLQQIPVWQAQDYCRALCEAFDTLYAEADGRAEVIDHGPNGRDTAAPFAGQSATRNFQQTTRG